ncbi:hypothetical protein SM124_05470 (plasmid) [Bacillus sp. 31A1R]|uniref:Uncharacterized protein n=1 Tax=Robertmurraya mangrovi TaxID=3098077 RepID=A0ABU5IVL4_9BACI|nr:hypothetical protein [Bacillus sp. 31A1R]MDZ5471189.1 hypothetical protein [Bacillus sp. 31A1R]
MEGIVFYWLFWMYWVLTTFFVKKDNPYRFKISIWLLFAIITSLHTIDLLGFQISATALFMLTTAYIVLGTIKGKTFLYMILTSFIGMLAYTSFQLFELYDPVWIIFNRAWLLGLIMAYFTILVERRFYMRLVTMVLSIAQGEILFAIVLRRFSFDYEIGSLSCLDVMAITAAFILAWSGFERLTALFEHHFNHLEREKHKLS